MNRGLIKGSNESLSLNSCDIIDPWKWFLLVWLIPLRSLAVEIWCPSSDFGHTGLSKSWTPLPSYAAVGASPLPWALNQKSAGLECSVPKGKDAQGACTLSAGTAGAAFPYSTCHIGAVFCLFVFFIDLCLTLGLKSILETHWMKQKCLAIFKWASVCLCGILSCKWHSWTCIWVSDLNYNPVQYLHVSPSVITTTAGVPG